MPPTRGADGGKRVLCALAIWRTYNQSPRKLALSGLRALCTNLRAANVHAALIQGVLVILKAAACNRLDG